MKIAFVLQQYLPLPPVLGGAVETLVDNILKENEIYHRFDITVYCRPDNEAKVKYNNYKFTEFVTSEPLKYFTKFNHFACSIFRKLFKLDLPDEHVYISRIAKHIKTQKYDAVWAENCVEFIGTLSADSAVPIYIHLHNRYLNSQLSYSKRCIDICSKVVTVSEYLKNDVLTVPDIPENKVNVLYNCIETKRFEHDGRNNKLREKYSVKPSDILFIYSGRIIKEKGIFELKEAFMKLKRNDCKLLIVGGISFGEEVSHLDTETIDKFIFTGFVDYNIIHEYYAAADAAVVPSQWEEVAGLTVVEAMASGLPLIISDAGGMREYAGECAVVVKRGECFVAELSKAISDMADNADKRLEMGKAALIHSQKFNLTAFYENFYKIQNQ